MKTRIHKQLKSGAIDIPALGFGCWAIGGPFYRGSTPVGWGDVDDNESKAALLAAFEGGIRFFDTADVYGAGHSERVVGEALKPIRDEVIIATKFNAVFDEVTKQVTGSDASPGHIRAACDASLKRLGTDRIDLLQFHDNGYPAEKADPVWETLESLVEAGKIRAYGWSTDFLDRAAVFVKGDNNVSVQFQHNILDPNSAMVAFCQENDLIGINRGPLAMGLLSGKYSADSILAENDVRGKNAPDWMHYFRDGHPNQEFLSMMESVREVLTSGGRTLVQGALAWLWGNSNNLLPIPGIRTVAQAKENSGALQYGPLIPAQMAEIDVILKR